VEGELAGTMKAIDAAVVAEAIKRPMAFFGRQLDEATVRAMHQPLVTAKEEHTPTVRTKVKVGAKAPTTVRIVTEEKQVSPWNGRGGCQGEQGDGDRQPE